MYHFHLTNNTISGTKEETWKFRDKKVRKLIIVWNLLKKDRVNGELIMFVYFTTNKRTLSSTEKDNVMTEVVLMFSRSQYSLNNESVRCVSSHHIL